MLTGKTRYRTGLFGRLILQVEAVVTRADWRTCEEDQYPVWRDAKVQDLLDSGIQLTGGRAALEQG